MGFQQTVFSGRKRASLGIFRQIRTTQERRRWDPELGRLKRSPHRLPNAWDEFIRRPERTWKRYRATQYRPRTL